VKGDSTEAVIARMEVRIKNGELKEALTESEGLTGPALDAAMPWLKQVRARLSVNQAMEKIESRLISSISNSAQQNSGVVRQKANDVSNGSSKQ
ncbi:MAG: mitofilin family membrane protein, partial [Desulfobulbia bacterium]